jgi:hypothetical protein
MSALLAHHTLGKYETVRLVLAKATDTAQGIAAGQSVKLEGRG